MQGSCPYVVAEALSHLGYDDPSDILRILAAYKAGDQMICGKSAPEGGERRTQEGQEESIHLLGAVFRNPVAGILQALDA